MNRYIVALVIIIILILSVGMMGQTVVTGAGSGASATPFAGVPSGACTSTQNAVNTLNGNYYACNSGVWLLIGPGAAGAAAFSTITAGTNAGQALIVGNGSSITVSGTGTNSATHINGTALSGLATGILKNTTATGVPSIAVAGDFPTLNQNTSGTAANLSGTPALPNGTTATTQVAGDNSTKLATTAYTDAAVSTQVTAAANYTSGDLVQAAGANRTTSSSGIQTSNVATAAANFTSGALVKSGGANKSLVSGDLSGDAATSGSTVVTVSKVNGIAYSGTAAAHSVEVITTANTTATPKVIPDCTDTGGNHLNFTQSTDAFSCGTSGGAGGGVTSSTLTSGTIPKASGAAAITDSLLTDNGTTLAYAGTGGIATAGTNGGLDLLEGTGAGLTAAASHDIIWADSTAHRVKANNNNGGATTLAQFTDKLSVFAATSSSELAGVLSDEVGSGPAMFSPKRDIMDAGTFCSDVGASDAYVCSLSPAITTYVTGVHYRFLANTANIGSATINLNSLGVKTIKKAVGGVTTDLADNDIRAGQWVDVVYDGTNMQMQSLLGNASAGGGATIASTSSVIKGDGAGNGIAATAGTDYTTPSSTEVMTNKTMTTPKIASVRDANGNVFIDSSSTASAVDSVTITNAATANPATVTVGATGTDTNVNLSLVPKGTGAVLVCPACTTAGMVQFGQGTANSAGTTAITEQAPTSVTSYVITKPGTKPTNNNSAQLYSNATPGVGAWAKMQQTVATTTSYTNATTTFSNVTGTNTLSFAVEASTTYVGTCYILWQGSAGTTGPKFQFTGPASPTAVASSMSSAVTATTQIYASAVAFSSAMANTGTITTATNFPAEIQFAVVNGANAGTVTLQAAANGAGTLTIQPGSYCTMQ